MFGFGNKIKGENVLKTIYFNTNKTFMLKDMPLHEDGTITYGNKTWFVSKSDPYLNVDDGFFSKKKVEPYYILSHDMAVPIKIMFTKTDKTLKNNPLVLNQLVDFKALKQMMNFRIVKEGGMGGGGDTSKMIKIIALIALLIGGYVFIRFFWLGGS